ncbi:hypothetical protein AMQ83_14535, partial [Paenibacillus riograndensis]
GRGGEGGGGGGGGEGGVDQRSEHEQGPAGAAGLAGAELGAQARLFAAGGCPPRRQQHRPAGLQQAPAVDRKEPPRDLVAKRVQKHNAPATYVPAEQAVPPARHAPGRPLSDMLSLLRGPAPLRPAHVRNPNPHQPGSDAPLPQHTLTPHGRAATMPLLTPMTTGPHTYR